MSTRGHLRLGTRGSELALRQAATVKAALEDRRYEVDLVEVETKGDEIRDELIHRLGKTGAFVRALDERVLEGDLDGAIHSMKDMPTESPEELIVAGIPERGAAGDSLVTPDGAADLDALPADAVVGTASLRRQAQLLAARPDLTVEPIRGNVDTRVEKLLAPHLQAEHQRRLEAAEDGDGNGDEDADTDGEDRTAYDRTPEEWFDDLAEIERRALGREPGDTYDALVLATAGLERLGLDHRVPTAELPPTAFVPAPGQGAIAVTAIDDTDASEAIHEAIDDPRTRVETTVERTVLAELGGGCIAPIGIHAVVQGDRIHTAVRVLSRDGEATVETTRDLPIRTYVDGARELAADLREEGAAELIEAARRDAEDREPPLEEGP